MTWARGHTHRFACREGKATAEQATLTLTTVNIVKGVWGDGSLSANQRQYSDQLWQQQWLLMRALCLFALCLCRQQHEFVSTNPAEHETTCGVFLAILRNWMRLQRSFLGCMWWFWTAQSSLAQFVVALTYTKVMSETPTPLHSSCLLKMSFTF